MSSCPTACLQALAAPLSAVAVLVIFHGFALLVLPADRRASMVFFILLSGTLQTLLFRHYVWRRLFVDTGLQPAGTWPVRLWQLGAMATFAASLLSFPVGLFGLHDADGEPRRIVFFSSCATGVFGLLVRCCVGCSCVCVCVCVFARVWVCGCTRDTGGEPARRVV